MLHSRIGAAGFVRRGSAGRSFRSCSTSLTRVGCLTEAVSQEMADSKKLSTPPSGWEWASIHQIAETSSGGTPSRKQSEYYEGDIPWVKSGELHDSVITSTEEHLSETALQNSSAKLCPKNTLLVALYGATIGKLGILATEAATNQAVCAIFLPPQVSVYYIGGRLEGPGWQSRGCG